LATASAAAALAALIAAPATVALTLVAATASATLEPIDSAAWYRFSFFRLRFTSTCLLRSHLGTCGQLNASHKDWLMMCRRASRSGKSIKIWTRKRLSRAESNVDGILVAAKTATPGCDPTPSIA